MELMPQPVTLASSSPSAQTGTHNAVLVAVKIPFEGLIWLFIKLWLASLIAAVLIAAIPVDLILLLNQVPGVFKH